MECWSQAVGFERRIFNISSEVLKFRPELLRFVFDVNTPKLRLPAEELLSAARGLSSGDRVLVSLCVDLWCEAADVKVRDLLRLDPENLKAALIAIAKWSV